MDSLNDLLSHAQAVHAGELLLMAGDIPAVRIGDHWTRLDHPRCTPHDLLTCAQQVLTAAQHAELERTRELEFQYPCDAPAASCNFHFQRGSLVLLARLISTGTPAPLMQNGSARV